MEHPGCFDFINAFILYDIVEEFAFFHELHDQEELLWSFNDLIELHNMGMTDEFQDVDLS